MNNTICIVPARMGSSRFPVKALKKFLLYDYAQMKEGPMERVESIDMLRFIEHKVPIKMLLCKAKTIGVDTPRDLEEAEKLMVSNSFF